MGLVTKIGRKLSSNLQKKRENTIPGAKLNLGVL